MISPNLRSYTVNDLMYNYYAGAQGYALGNGTNALLTGLQTVSTTPGFIQGMVVYNPNASVAYLEVFDTTAAVTLGTTKPNFILPIAATSTFILPTDLALFNGAQIAAVTAANGATPVATGLPGTIFYN